MAPAARSRRALATLRWAGLAQARVIRRMTRDLNFPIKIVISPIVRECDGEATLAETACPWILGQPREFQISAKGDRLQASVDGTILLEARDSALTGGAAGFLLDQGGIIVQSADVEAMAGTE